MNARRTLPRLAAGALAAILLLLLAPAALAQGGDPGSWNLFEWTVSGGILMVPIGTCSVLLVAFAFERSVRLRRERIAPKRFLGALEDALRKGNVDEAASLCSTNANPFSAAIAAGLRRVGDGAAEVERAVQSAAQKEITDLRRHLRPFAVITSVAPLLGLLGTVQGMIQVFGVVSSNEGALGSGSFLAGGIATALVTTFAGLTVAIPSLLVHQYFVSRIQGWADEVVRLHHDALAPVLVRRAA